jgi:hypothetical protein
MDFVDRVTAATLRRTSGAPDWAAITGEIHCPLCEYNLRGLTEPRCPECGHQFDWLDLLDRSKWEHPWLFEHAQQRRFRSLLKTLWNSVLPTRFWTSVKTTHTVRPARLVLVWAFMSLFCAIPALPVLEYVRLCSNIPQLRQSLLRSSLRSSGGPTSPNDSNLQMWVQRAYPYPMPWDWQVWSNSSVHLGFAAAAIAWPWLTFAGLLLFRQTMQQAKIKPAHVFRCAVYTSAIASPLLFPVAWSMRRGGIFIQIYHVDPLLPLLITITAIVSYRLSVAYALYLKFPQPLVTCLLVETVVVLSVLAAAAIAGA